MHNKKLKGRKIKINNNPKAGFSLVELLTTILIISLVFGISFYFINNTINSSKSKSKEISVNNVKTAATLYSKELPDNVSWNEKNTTCVLLEDLVNSGYLKQKDIDALDDVSSVILTKNSSNTIIGEKLDRGNICHYDRKDIPTCNKIEPYNGKNQNLVSEIEGVTLKNNNQIYAGSYIITASLDDRDNTSWSDGTKDDKKITCTIKKATPYLTMSDTGVDNTDKKVGDIITSTLSSTVNGTIKVKSTNTNYVEASLLNGNNTIKGFEENENNNPKLQVKILSTRKITTYVRVTLIPEDKENYNEVTTTYTVGQIEKKEVEIPTHSICKNVLYSGQQELLIDTDKVKSGYTLFNIYGKEAGKYTITAKLNYGYKWKNKESFEKQTFECEIYNKVKIKYNSGNLIYGLDNVSNISPEGAENDKNNHMSYSVSNGTVTVTAKDNSGYGVSNGRVYLETGKTYIFNCNHSHTWGYTSGAGTAGIVLMLNGSTDGGTGTLNEKYYRFMNSDKNYTFSVAITGEYWIRFDVRKTGQTSTFSDISISYDIETRELQLNNKYTFPNVSYRGHTLKGWYTTMSGNNIINANTTVTNITEHTIYGRWNPNILTIQYNGNGGVWNSTNKTYSSDSENYARINGSRTLQSIKYGSSVGVPNGLYNYNNTGGISWQRNGYSVPSGNQWCANSNGTGTCFNQDSSELTSNQVATAAGCNFNNGNCTATLYVNWKPNTYTVTLNNQSATSAGTNALYETYGTKFSTTSGGAATTTITKPSRSYTVTFNYNGNGTANTSGTATYTFGGYYSGTNGSGASYINANGTITAANTVTSSNATWYAKWTVSQVATPTPTRTGYIFAGWFDSPSGGSRIASGGANYTPTANQTLYAQWTIISTKVNFKCNGGTGDNTQIFKYNENKMFESKCTKTGYAVASWNTNANGSGTSFPVNATANNSFVTGRYPEITLHAQWAPKKLTINFDCNGGAGGNNQTFTYGVTGQKFNHECTRSGYSGIKWTWEKTGTFTGNYSWNSGVSDGFINGFSTGNTTKTLYAQWAKNPTITFSPNGGTHYSNTTVTVTCKSDDGIESFTAYDNTGDTGSQSTNQTNTKARKITLVSTGSRTITAECKSKNSASTKVTKTFTIIANSSGGGSSGGSSEGPVGGGCRYSAFGAGC